MMADASGDRSGMPRGVTPIDRFALTLSALTAVVLRAIVILASIAMLADLAALNGRLYRWAEKEPGLVRGPGKIKHHDLTGMDDGHTDTSEPSHSSGPFLGSRCMPDQTLSGLTYACLY